jgi:hypothetical protein
MGRMIPLLEDRSGAETDDRCGMRYWFNRKAGPNGKGIVPKKEALALTVGRETHEDLKAIAEMERVTPEAVRGLADGLVKGLTDQDKQFREEMELVYRRAGWIIAFGLWVEPVIRAEYENVMIEDEIILDRGDLWVPITPDRILRKKDSGILVYREYKTTLSSDQKWQQSWRYAIQLHAGIAAAQEELNQKVAYGQIMGLMKGRKSQTDGRLLHPYVWAYYNHQKDEWSHEYKTGSDWIPMPVWEYPGGLYEWVVRLGHEVGKAQFPHSPPVFLDQRMLDDWLNRRRERQRIIKVHAEAVVKDEKLRGIIFERRTNQCRPPFGDECPYLLPCWNATAGEEPLKTGLYIEREPHHEVEVVGLEDV